MPTGVTWWQDQALEQDWPCLTDAATGGVLLEMVFCAQPADGHWMVVYPMRGGPPFGLRRIKNVYRGVIRDEILAVGSTLGEACARALLTLWDEAEGDAS